MRALSILLLGLVLAGCTTLAPSAPVPLPAPVPAPAPAPTTPCEQWPAAVAGERQILVWYHCGEEPKAVIRAVPAGTEPLQAAYAELVKGPTESELKAGFASFFKAETAEALRSVSLQEGLLIVDLADVRQAMSGASSSAGALMLVGQLGRTGAQFEGVRQMEFRLEGSCAQFGEWIQTGCGVFAAEQYRR